MATSTIPTKTSYDLLELDFRESLDEVLKDGYMTIEQVRNLFATNTPKRSFSSYGELICPDADLLAHIDSGINYPIFITEDYIFTRSELMDRFPFEIIGKFPEDVFSRQELGKFEYCNGNEEPIYEIVSRDMNCSSGFMFNNDTSTPREILVVKTNIYIGRESWKDFQFLNRFVRMSKNLLISDENSSFSSAFNKLLLDDSTIRK